MDRSMSVASRAALAVALMIGFYLLALAIAGGLLGIVYAEWTLAHRIHLKLAFFCIAGAGLILWSVFPRPDRFQPPGPLLDRSSQPRLFTTIEEVAAATQQTMPAEVYLVPDLNAWVAQRGGVMGFGSRRVMGLGLPLMQILTVSELRAVLAHEFGHYHGGDTRLGPWVYKTRAAIGRTLEGLAHHSDALQLPFVWYGNMFLRVTHAVSRRQEFVADALAARVAGVRPLIQGLRKVHGGALAFGPYWSGEVAPVLNAGYLPPLAAGFQRFVANEDIAKAVDENVEKALQEAQTNPYDTHPPLRERTVAVRDLPQGDELAEDPPAISLLDRVETLEQRLLATLADESRVRSLKRVAWEEVGLTVHLPMWERAMQQDGSLLAGLTTDSLPERARSLEELAKALPVPGGQSPTPEQRRQRAAWLLGAALALALARRGWQIRALPGEPILLEGPSGTLTPFETIPALSRGQLDATAWQQLCAELGIAALPLAEAAPAGAPTSSGTGSST